MAPTIHRDRVRLRPVALAEYERLALDWYADPEVLQFSEGGADPYGRDQIRAMYEALSRQGELYVIELAIDDAWCAIGDAALLPDALPIVIGRPEHRSRGIGTAALQLLIARARELGWAELRVAAIDPQNIRAQRLYQRAGFTAIATQDSVGMHMRL